MNGGLVVNNVRCVQEVKNSPGFSTLKFVMLKYSLQETLTVGPFFFCNSINLLSHKLCFVYTWLWLQQLFILVRISVRLLNDLSSSERRQSELWAQWRLLFWGSWVNIVWIPTGCNGFMTGGDGPGEEAYRCLTLKQTYGITLPSCSAW